MSARRWPREAAVCEHVAWGTVSLVDTTVETMRFAGRDIPLVKVYPDQLHNRRWSIAFYAESAWLDHLKPLTPTARQMLAIAKESK